MATKLPPVDVAIVGLGWTGGIIARELAPTGLRIVAFERGPARDGSDQQAPQKMDELRYAVRHTLMQDTARDTLTFRNHAGEVALPMRQLGSFMPGEGVGGAGMTWNGITMRWSEWDQAARSAIVAQYGASVIPEDMTVADWGVSYAELEPYYDKFEKTCGTTGTAGNLRGERIDGGNVFESPRQNEYPLPPMRQTQSMVMFEAAARALGLHPFPQPGSNASQPYVNPDGMRFGACQYCGFCEKFGCQVNAKAGPQFTVIPVALSHPNVELRARSQVLRVNLDASGTRAVGVTYLDADGREFEQPAEVVVLTAYALENVHLMLLSGIGRPYDPVSGSGVVGRNYSYQVTGGATMFFDDDTWLHPFMGSGALGTVVDDFDAGNFDSLPAGFLGGGMIFHRQPNGRPIGFHPTPRGTPGWGLEWKHAVKRYYERTAVIAAPGCVMPYRQNFLDLDPTYRDAFGRPLVRMTFDFQPNELRMAQFQADRAVEIARAMGAVRIDRSASAGRYSIVPYQSTHNTGGAMMGTDPGTSAVNRFLQAWDVPNVFVVGASALPQNAGRPPTAPVGALAYWAAEAIRDKYLPRPGSLA